ncbi:GFA family protein [Labrenzia sp. PHM005]|uniref:GFA family protein n=1 Tax=Labrenzia sp. PHM005 TaxID=2590016 RepID=UPI0011406689|nr:GFA family protein [Labrenzia sp. PHM005]QDG78568.1 GFA family protein [Labrenzia sp. PHM005]
MTKLHSGSCLCGSVEFTVEGDFDGLFLCHCTSCQKDTGSAYAAILASSSAKLNWQTGAKDVATYTLPDKSHARSFCAQCGSALPILKHEGALLTVPAGSLKENPEAPPVGHIFMAEKAGWDEKLEDVPKYDAFPG